MNTYGYVGGNPLKYSDSSGLAFDTIADVGFILYDLYRIGADNVFGDEDNFGENCAALGADAAGFFIPFATGLGLGVRAGKVVPTTMRQLQKKFKHAEDFGVSGNYNSANAEKFNQAIQKHVNARGTKEVSGTYRGNPVKFHTDPNSGLTVIQNSDGSFLSGWKLNPQQLMHVLRDGKL